MVAVGGGIATAVGEALIVTTMGVGDRAIAVMLGVLVGAWSAEPPHAFRNSVALSKAATLRRRLTRRELHEYPLSGSINGFR